MKLNQKLDALFAEEFGRRFCNNCRCNRPLEGGRRYVMATGKSRWQCGVCEAAKQARKRA